MRLVSHAQTVVCYSVISIAS